ncbi:class I SAM-dependent methyltransferase [Tepidibacillus marianensis]|uniref:class I SAM-dependent methyltransferase n=1 Tax=Tepidibacillus marianensis TaxID=3131995 RepID=UPI0030D5B8E7
MSFLSIIQYGKELIKERVKDGDTVIDATCGNGYDSVFLAELVGRYGKVFGFDIQEEAIIHTNQYLSEKKLNDRVQCIMDNHANIIKWINEPIQAAIFNLGYLPGSDKRVTTQGETTIQALTSILGLLANNGIVVLIIYTGHDQGKEARIIEKWLQNLSQKEFSVLKVSFINQLHDAPYLLAVEKRSA